ncbi:MAG: type II toxin-antitoxin system VapC family toxin [Bauldia sp.]|nr:MAG: type II toxin-antitoxin system VapC family toxin [Bauldia sp.]MBZ0228829.1 type II toxin-antitoxin system VapC family toxin [Bauldia sp.]
MIVDTSAIMAVLLQEEDAERYLEALDRYAPRRMSGVSFVELTIVCDRRDNPIPAAIAEDFIRDARIAVEPVTAGQIAWAHTAHLRYGRGRHKAKLNLGDCFAYALAKEAGEPLLFKGGDFALTDLAAVV